MPIGLFDPKTTYESKGADHVHIASNGTADGHRIGTAQVLCRNRPKMPNLPRHGQPKMCMAFRGKGLRISQEEMKQYHKDVHVQFQPCAWYDSVLSNKWVMEVAKEDMKKSEATGGKRHLLNCDNLSSQTSKTNPQFSKLLGQLCNADVFNGCAGNTDEIQVVDAGVGALLKRFSEGIQTEWLDDEANWKEWQEKSLPAGRKRILLTHWYGEAWEKVCERFDFQGVFTKCGSALTADGTGDELIKLQKLAEFSFDVGDAERDPKTGEFATEEPDSTDSAAAAARISSEEDDDNEELAQETVEDDGESSDGGQTTDDDLDGDDFVCPPGVEVLETCPSGGACANMSIYYRYDSGWAKGTVQRLVEHSDNHSLNGLFATVYDDGEFFNDLDQINYGAGKH